jgi:hypothetical protein
VPRTQTVKRIVTIIIFAMAALAAVAVLLISRTSFFAAAVSEAFPELTPKHYWVRNLTSDNPAVVRESLSYLRQQRELVGEWAAVPLLQHPDDYVWLNAALYLGSIHNGEATPYLIKALRHSAVLADKDTVACLRTTTGQDFGSDFTRWQQWWLAENPDWKNFDWESHLGSAPRLPGKKSHP